MTTETATDLPATEPDPRQQQLLAAPPLSPAAEAARIERQRAMAETTFRGDISPFSNGDAFKLACQIAERISYSSMIPDDYKGKPENVLPRIVDAVGDQVEIHIDGGIRSGQDVLKSVALGAKGTYIGRAFLYGLGAGGEAGVTKALEVIRKELDVTMALCGHRDIRNIRHDMNDTIIAENPFATRKGM